MRRFATTFALLTIAFSTAACDPYQAITNALPQGCNPPTGPQLSAPPSAAPNSLNSAPDINVPAPNPNTNH